MFNLRPSLCVSQGTASKLADDITITRIVRRFCERGHMSDVISAGGSRKASLGIR